ncbi:MAG: helix-turn-helix domain-containing protein [Solirubrobacteraceae bacterium]
MSRGRPKARADRRNGTSANVSATGRGSGKQQNPPESANGSLPERLRALRHGRALTLTQVASGTGISASFLSLVENGRSDITIGRLTRLIQFYGVSLSDLVPDARGVDPDIVRSTERRQLHSTAEGMDIFLLAPPSDEGMMPMLLAFEPGAGRKDYGRHAGQEFLFVLQGDLLLELEGSEPRRMKAGDAACYPGDRPHLLKNASSSKPLRLICVDSTRVL